MSSPAITAEVPAKSSRTYHTTICSLVLVFFIAWFGVLELRGLFIPDEGRYAEIPREMLATGDWVTPRLNDLKYFEKPPLQYWLTTVSFAVLGEDEWTARLPAALLGFCAVAAAGLTARRFWGNQAGLLASAILGSGWGFYLSGQYLTLDMTLSSLLGITLCAFLRAQVDHATAKENRYWMLAAWGSAALAVLAKGLIGVVVPALALIAYSTVARDWRIWARLHFFSGLLLLLSITLPWFLLVQQRNPEFFHFFFIQEHFQRFSTDMHSRVGAGWYYLPILLVGLMPWTPALFLYFRYPASRRWAPQQHALRFRPDRFCIAWTLSTLIFFSVSHSKLPAYIFPVFPALALLLAYRFPRFTSFPVKWCAWSLAGMGALFLIGLPALPQWEKFAAIGSDALDALPLLYLASALLLLGGLFSVWLADRKQATLALGTLITASFGFWWVIFGFLHECDAQFSSERLIEKLSNDTKPFQSAAPFYSIGQFDHSIPFYLGRPVTLVNVRGELGYGIDTEPYKVIGSVEQFERIWRALDRQAYAVMTPAQAAEFSRAGLPMTELDRDRRFVIVSRFR